MTPATKKLREALEGAKAFLTPDSTTSFKGSLEDWLALANESIALLENSVLVEKEDR